MSLSNIETHSFTVHHAAASFHSSLLESKTTRPSWVWIRILLAPFSAMLFYDVWGPEQRRRPLCCHSGLFFPRWREKFWLLENKNHQTKNLNQNQNHIDGKFSSALLGDSNGEREKCSILTTNWSFMLNMNLYDDNLNTAVCEGKVGHFLDRRVPSNTPHTHTEHNWAC